MLPDGRVQRETQCNLEIRFCEKQNVLCHNSNSIILLNFILIILYYTILYYIILYHIILYYIIL